MKVLDVGCGDGESALDMGITEHDYVGIDIEPNNIRKIEEKGLQGEVVNVDQGLPFRDKTFDKVQCKAVIEHVEDPLFVIKECRRVTKKHGTILVIVPSDVSYDVWGDYTHMRAFRKDALRNLLEDGGWANITIQARHPIDSFGHMMKSILRIVSPTTPYGYPRAWAAHAYKG